LASYLTEGEIEAKPSIWAQLASYLTEGEIEAKPWVR
jgi:hypothetical protein